MVGNKFLQDDGEDDDVVCSEWAASGGLELSQLKKLEVEFLNAIVCYISNNLLILYIKYLIKRCSCNQFTLLSVV